MADAVWASPMEVAAWEAGALHMPPEQARRVRALAEEDRRREAVRGAHLQPCAWAEANAPGLHELLTTASLDRVSPQARFHLDDCPLCTRAVHFGRTLRLPPLDPALGFDPPDLLGSKVRERPDRVLVPLVIVGGLALAFVGLKALDRDPRSQRELWWFNVGPAVLLGAVVFHGLGNVLRPLSLRRPYLAGTIRGAAGVLTAAIIWTARAPGHRWPLSNPLLLAGAAALAAGIGAVAVRVSRWWADPNPAESRGGGITGARRGLLFDRARAPDVGGAAPHTADGVIASASRPARRSRSRPR